MERAVEQKKKKQAKKAPLQAPGWAIADTVGVDPGLSTGAIWSERRVIWWRPVKERIEVHIATLTGGWTFAGALHEMNRKDVAGDYIAGEDIQRRNCVIEGTFGPFGHGPAESVGTIRAILRPELEVRPKWRQWASGFCSRYPSLSPDEAVRYAVREAGLWVPKATLKDAQQAIYDAAGMALWASGG